jgi:hypothetical protein
MKIIIIIGISGIITIIGSIGIIEIIGVIGIIGTIGTIGTIGIVGIIGTIGSYWIHGFGPKLRGFTATNIAVWSTWETRFASCENWGRSEAQRTAVTVKIMS